MGTEDQDATNPEEQDASASPDATASPAEPVGAPRQASLLRSSALMASGTLVSRVLGFVRAALLVAAIGGAAGQVSASFQVANTLPNTVYNLLAAGVFDAVLVPQIVRALKRRSGDVYVNRLITLAGTILFGVTVAAMVIAPLLVTILAGSFSGSMRTLTIAFSLICLPQIFFYGLYNLLGELLNARGAFGPYMWAPVVNNIVAIAGLLVFMAMFGGAGSDSVRSVDEFTSGQFWLLAGTATLGVICQSLVLILPMRRAGVRLRPDFHFRGTSFGSASKVAGWTFATLGISQLGVISTTQLATRADDFAIANNVLTMAGYTSYTTMFMIYMVPQSLISVSLATAIFTRLANAAADRDHRAVADQYTTGLNLITLLSLLSAAILIAGATPLVQMVMPGATNPDVIHAYSLVLIALMPGVASTGMVLMSQRVFFAYEDAKPVFLMGIVPTAIQVIVGWSIYFLADAQWWTFGASLAETICRLTQGFIAVFWVARKNVFVNPGRIIATYLKYLIAAVASWAVSALLMRVVGAMSLVDNGGGRFVLSALKLVLVAVVAVVVYFAVLHVIDPANSSAALGYVARRFRLPARVAAVLAGPADTSARDVEADLPEPPPPSKDERVISAAASRTGWSMISRQWSASDPSHTGEFPIVPPVLPEDSEDPLMRVPSFDEILHPTSTEQPPAPMADQGGGAGDIGEDAPDGTTPDEDAAPEDAAAVAASGAAISAAALPERRSVSAWVSTRHDAPDDTHRATDDPGTDGRPDAPAVLPDPGLAPPPEPPSSDDGRANGGDDGDGAGGGRRRIDPTVPAMALAAALVVVGGAWGVHQALTPVSAVQDLAQSLAAGVPSAQSEQSQSDTSTEGTAAPEPVVAPVIQAAKVFSWNNDGGDHEDLSINLIDGDASTQWYSRYYDLNQFTDDNTVTILVTLEQTSTLSGLTVSMDPSTSGGELVVRAVDDPQNPRSGTELATTALSATTDIALDPPAQVRHLSLSFQSMPTDFEGKNRAWVNEITVR